MIMDEGKDHSEQLQQQLREAIKTRRGMCITGGNSKSFYGRSPVGEPFNTADHRGIVKYEPTELVLTARSGTPLYEVEKMLDERGQFLPFEPPHFSPGATLGGAIATGLAGPARPYRGSARDFILGIKCLTGHGEILKFGGEVMKNVAGFDASRLMAGAMGTLGVLLDITLKVLPLPVYEKTLVFGYQVQDALIKMNQWAGRPLPVSAAVYDGRYLYLRLSGTQGGVESAYRQLGGDLFSEGTEFWQDIREHQHAFFHTDKPLWRVSVPAATPPIDIDGQWLIDWGGAQRWIKTDMAMDKVRESVAMVGGHATVFRGGQRDGDIFQSLPASLFRLHKNLKAAFDPHGILNPGRVYPDL
jgi:glycolate dehydrogenase FAD-binding subunit